MRLQPIILSAALLASGSLNAQVRPQPKATPKKAAPAAAASAKTAASAKNAKPETKFALDVLRSAVALPQPDPQDRLRVLGAAINVVLPMAPALARQWSREGAQVEAELINSGTTPAVSVLALGNTDCKTASEFADRVAPANVSVAEQALIGIATNCGPSAKNAVRSKAEAAMQQNVIAPRLIMSLIDQYGATSTWSQQTFTRLFAALPDPKKNVQEAPNFAAMYANMAPQIDKDAARTAGISFLTWLGKLDEGNERNMAVNIATDAMKTVLGAEEYGKALERDVVARQVAETAGQPAELSHPEEESTSVLEAMKAHKAGDQSDSLRDMPPSSRAREAAALGFAAGTEGDPQAAERYFDVAFSAADETWGARTPEQDASEVISEVCQAAAQVNSVKALSRAQKLSDPSAQAIGMIAVARVVASKSIQ